MIVRTLPAGPCEALVVSASDLKRSGALMLSWQSGTLTPHPQRPPGRDRPWSRAPPEEQGGALGSEALPPDTAGDE